MSKLRERAQEHFPAVLLTLISIIQALALELLWARVTGTESLWQGDRIALVEWAMISVAFLGILLLNMALANVVLLVQIYAMRKLWRTIMNLS